MKLPMQCTNAIGENDQPAINGYGRHDLRNARASSWNTCENYIIVTALVQDMGGSAGLARGIELHAFHWPLIWNSNTVMHQAVEKVAADFKAKRVQDASANAPKVKY